MGPKLHTSGLQNAVGNEEGATPVHNLLDNDAEAVNVALLGPLGGPPVPQELWCCPQ